MTFQQIQDRVMNRLGLNSDEARRRIKQEINDRYREVQTSCNLAPTRFGSVNFSITAGTNTSTASGIANLITLYDPTVLKRPLDETTILRLRQLDTAAETSGPPERWAIKNHVNDSITVQLYPKPSANGTLVADALLAGTDLDDDTDQPTIPVDFHDILVRGVMADEYTKLEKMSPSATREEQKFEKRLGELRYFLAKSAYLRRQAVDVYGFLGLTSTVWPYSNL